MVDELWFIFWYLIVQFSQPLPRQIEQLEDALKARKKFLDSDTGIGIDLFFGGGQYDHQRQAAKGYSVDAGIQQKHPEWFDDKVIPYRFSGEIFYDKQGRYYGVCLAAFGICWNNQRLAEMTEASFLETIEASIRIHAESYATGEPHRVMAEFYSKRAK